MIRKSILVLAVLFLASLCFSQTQTKKRSSHPQASPQETAKAAPGAIDEKLFGAMRWRQVGPFRGGRVLAVTGVPGEPNVFYFGAAAGGVWKSTDAGANWAPIFDKEQIASIGSIAVSPSDHNVIFTSAPVRPVFAAISPTATASTNRWMVARLGRTSV